MLEKYSSAKAIHSARMDGLTNLLYNNSHGRYNQERASELKNLAKESLGLDNPTIELQIHRTYNNISIKNMGYNKKKIFIQ